MKPTHRRALAAIAAGSPVPQTLAMLEAFAALGEGGLIEPERDAHGSLVRWRVTQVGHDVLLTMAMAAKQ